MPINKDLNLEELNRRMRIFRRRLRAVQQANKDNCKLLQQLKEAYQAKINNILKEVEVIAHVLDNADTAKTNEARTRLYQILEQENQNQDEN